MSFFFAPFIFLLELLGFLLSVAVMYGLALIAAVTFLIYGIAGLKKAEPEIIYNTITNEVVKYVEIEPEPTLTCERVTGCELFPNAVTDEEYCPTCIVK